MQADNSPMWIKGYRRFAWARILVVLITLIGSAAVGVARSGPANASPCTQQTGVSVSDPNTGWSWSSYWWCPNAQNAVMYGDATYNTPTAQMFSTYSWFVCYRRGWVHPGGNDVWYYSAGDRALPDFESRQAWGYMPASSVYTHIDPWPGVPQCPEGHSPPVNVDGKTTVLMLHGYHQNGTMNCGGWWDGAKDAYRAIGYSSTQLVTLKYYNGDTNCNADIRRPFDPVIDANTSIATIGAILAWYIYDKYSRWGKSVDVVAHSMGGLIIRTAITGTAHPTSAPFNSYGWPPYLYVRDVSTLGTPHEGGFLNTAIGCVSAVDNLQCREMVEGNYFIQNWIKPYGNPQAWWYNGRGGTDWTLIGSNGDGTVLNGSSLEFHSSAIVGHKFLYTYGSPMALTHNALTVAPANASYTYFYCDYFTSCDQSPPFCITCLYAYNINTWRSINSVMSPVQVAAWGNFYTSLW